MKSYERESFLTKRQVQVLKKFKEIKNIQKVAEELGIKEATTYQLMRKAERNIERAIRTLEIAQELRLLDEERMAPLMKDVY